MTISLGWFITLCIFGAIGFIAALWFVYKIGFEIGEMIANYNRYKDYYLEHQKERFLELIRKQQEEQEQQEVEEDE